MEVDLEVGAVSTLDPAESLGPFLFEKNLSVIGLPVDEDRVVIESLVAIELELVEEVSFIGLLAGERRGGSVEETLRIQN